MANILIVDDNPNNLRLLSDILTKSGYTTRRAINGNLALQAVEATKFDLILLDINMPELDGYEVCRQLKQNKKTKNIPLIFLSAYNETEDKVKGFEIGGIDYITKPFQAEEVLARIKTHIKTTNIPKRLQKINRNLQNQISETDRQLKIQNLALKKTQEQLLDRSLFDPITGLLNRVSWMGKLRESYRKKQQNTEYNFAVSILRCDRLDSYNILFQDNFKNRFLVIIAQQLKSLLPNSSILGQGENNDFLILFEDADTLEKIAKIIEDIHRQLTVIFIRDNQEVFINCYFGLVWGNIKESLEILLIDCELALNYAHSERHKYSIFTPEIRQNLQSLLQQELQLKKDLEEESFTCQYQPIASLESNKIKALKVVVLHNNKKIEIDRVITLAKRSGLIAEFDRWLLQQVGNRCRRMQEISVWGNDADSKLDENITIYLSLTEVQFFHSQLSSQIEEAIFESNIYGRNIVLEVPITALISKPELSSTILQQLKKLEVQLSLDDFFISYLALNQQYQFPFNYLKLNNYSIANLEQNINLVQNILEIAKQLKLKIIAAAIDTPDREKKLRELGCELGFGKWIAQKISGNLG